MNIRITSFTNPFSFFCVADNFNIKEHTFENINLEEYISTSLTKSWMSDLHHGQYVLVLWKNQWNRGIVDMGTQFLIWLIDYGKYVRPNHKTPFIDLPSEYKKYPTKVFEASIHGVVPMDMNLSDECQIKNQATTKWNQGSLDKAQALLKVATRIYFYPLAILSTKVNDIIIGDLILELPGGSIVNIIEQLEMWPVFLERNSEAYMKELPRLYITQKRHRGCLLKPVIQHYKLPTITFESRLEEYENILKKPNLTSDLFRNINDVLDISSDGNIPSGTACVKNENVFKITQDDLEKYSQRYITINGRKYNVINVLVNKARDLKMCDKYKDHDVKSMGRGCSYRR